MDNFLNVFAEEAADLIAQLEKALLSLEENPDDKRVVEQVFRTMHTLKGNSNMFGFEALGHLTHHLETLYEAVRDGSKPLTPALLEVTLAAVDHFKCLLADPAFAQESTRQGHTRLTWQVEALLKGGGDGESMPDAPAAAPVAVPAAPHTYLILFRPAPGAFAAGANPLFLLDELAHLGRCHAMPRTHAVPALADLDPARAYLYWEILLATVAGETAVRDAFMFVPEGTAWTVRAVAPSDLFEHPELAAWLAERALSEKEIEPAELQAFRQPEPAPVPEAPAAEKPAPEKLPVPHPPAGKPGKKETGAHHADAGTSIRVASDKLDGLMNLVSELVTTQARLSLYAEQNALPDLIAIAENVEKISRQLRDNTFSICLIPLETVVIRFQRLVRDLSHELGKEVAFVTEGTDTELDKTIIENLADPLLHILRNSIDHGIESADERRRKGKPAQGTILLKAFYSGAHVHIQVKDDGAGIDARRVREKAISRGLLHADATLSEKELFDLIFVPGFSTAAAVTDVSGRGVGMDVVRRKIADLRGEVEVASAVDAGTTITIKLPLTLSILDGLLVGIGDTRFVIPLSVVGKCYEIDHAKLVSTYNNVVHLDGEALPYFYLRDEFDITGQAPDIEKVVIIRYEDKQVGLTVDEIVGEYQAVLKPLGKLYRNQEMVSGASILGDGTIALVLDTNKIIKLCAAREPAYQ
jgi:two-component system chemotaxis sensor kinase CheA